MDQQEVTSATGFYREPLKLPPKITKKNFKFKCNNSVILYLEHTDDLLL